MFEKHLDELRREITSAQERNRNMLNSKDDEIE